MNSMMKYAFAIAGVACFGVVAVSMLNNRPHQEHNKKADEVAQTAHGTQEHAHVRQVSSMQDFQAQVLSNEKLTVVMFHAHWCQGCKVSLPEFEKCAEQNKDSYAFFMCDTDAADALSSDQKINVIPTLIFYKNSKEVDRTTGRFTAQELLAKLEKLK